MLLLHEFHPAGALDAHLFLVRPVLVLKIFRVFRVVATTATILRATTRLLCRGTPSAVNRGFQSVVYLKSPRNHRAVRHHALLHPPTLPFSLHACATLSARLISKRHFLGFGKFTRNFKNFYNTETLRIIYFNFSFSNSFLFIKEKKDILSIIILNLSFSITKIVEKLNYNSLYFEKKR